MADLYEVGRGFYKIEGKKMPRVTSITSFVPWPADRWAAKASATYAVESRDEWAHLSNEDAIYAIKSAPYKQRDKAADRGTLVHKALESYLGGKSDDEIVNSLDSDHVGFFYGLLHFLDAVEPQIIATESVVFSKRHHYAGKVDIVAEINGERVIIDAKTTAKEEPRVYNSHGAQVAAYANADFIIRDKVEPFGGATRAIVVSVTNEGEFLAVPFDDLTPWFEYFKAAYGIYSKRLLKVPDALRV